MALLLMRWNKQARKAGIERKKNRNEREKKKNRHERERRKIVMKEKRKGGKK
jgi:hypothetical protein